MKWNMSRTSLFTIILVLIYQIQQLYSLSLRCNFVIKHQKRFYPPHSTATASPFDPIDHGSVGESNKVLLDYDKLRFRTVPGNSFATRMGNPFRNFLKSCFVPAGELSSDYFNYSFWRIAQRLISATNNVFGTQALLLALGFKTNKIGKRHWILVYSIT